MLPYRGSRFHKKKGKGKSEKEKAIWAKGRERAPFTSAMSK